MIWAAVESSDLDCVKTLWQAGASVRPPSAECNIEQAHYCYRSYVQGDGLKRRMTAIKAIDNFLIQIGFNLNSPAPDVGMSMSGETILMRWARGGTNNRNRLEHLLTVGSELDLELTDSLGRTVLHYYANSYCVPHKSTMMALIKAGARLDAQDIHGRNVLHFATMLWCCGDVTDLFDLVDMASIVYDTLDSWGYTPFMLLQERAGPNRNAVRPWCWPNRFRDINDEWSKYLDIGTEEAVAMELQSIAAFRNLLCNIQAAQGVSPEARYPDKYACIL